MYRLECPKLRLRRNKIPVKKEPVTWSSITKTDNVCLQKLAKLELVFSKYVTSQAIILSKQVIELSLTDPSIGQKGWPSNVTKELQVHCDHRWR